VWHHGGPTIAKSKARATYLVSYDTEKAIKVYDLSRIMSEGPPQ
jgi:hypothetical protein